MKKVLKRIVNIVVDILVVLVLMVSILVVILSLTTKSSGVPNIFGIAPLSVQTASMEDTINPGDLIFCDVAEDEEEYAERNASAAFRQGCSGKRHSGNEEEEFLGRVKFIHRI